jgi:hypothetical protein
MKYTFGKSREATMRLEAIARFFNPLATYLIAKYVPDSPSTVVDVGCGPGFTTDMLYHAAKEQHSHINLHMRRLVLKRR